MSGQKSAPRKRGAWWRRRESNPGPEDVGQRTLRAFPSLRSMRAGPSRILCSATADHDVSRPRVTVRRPSTSSRCLRPLAPMEHQGGGRPTEVGMTLKPRFRLVSFLRGHETDHGAHPLHSIPRRNRFVPVRKQHTSHEPSMSRSLVGSGEKSLAGIWRAGSAQDSLVSSLRVAECCCQA